jgi:predicted amidohydrolase YtcJ
MGAVPADLVLVGNVVTVDAARSWARAVAVAGDRIVAVGTEAEVRERVGAATEVLSGAAIVPGFQDAHVHPLYGGRNLLNVNLDDLNSLADYRARIDSFARAHPDLPWIVGGGWYGPVFVATDGPRKEDLDAIVADRPVFLMNTDTHAAWVNSRTLELAGIDTSTPDPWDGYYVRDPDGSPTGCLQEGAAYTLLQRLVPRPDTASWRAALAMAQRELHALGITGWQDAWVEADMLEAYGGHAAAGELSMRVVASLWWDRHRGLEQIDDLVALRERASGVPNLHPTTVKIMLDGCPESCTGSMLEPYEPPHDQLHDRGIQFVDPETLDQALIRLDALGFQVHQHALGDRAFRTALDAIEAARTANGPSDNRHHVAHLQLPDRDDLPRLRVLGVTANIQPFWAAPDPAIEELTKPRVGARAAGLYPFGSVHRCGASLCIGSDWPVSTPDPWQQLDVAVNRQVIGNRGLGTLGAGERLDLMTSIAAFARGSAWVNHDDEAGSIEVGKRADLVVLDRDPFDREAGEIHETRPLITIAAGRVVHEA